MTMKTEPFAGRSVEMRKDAIWLSSEDLFDAGDVLVEIEGVYKHTNAVFDGGRIDTVFALRFVGKGEKQLVLNATNRKFLVNLCGTTDVSKWKGKKVVLYVRRDVPKKGGARGEVTCGIRIKTP